MKDFNDWLKTDEGKECANFTNLTGEKYLLNRLFDAYYAGKDSLQARITELEEKKFTFSELEDVVMAFGMHWKNTQLPDGPVRFYFRKWFEGTCKNGVSP